MVIHDASQLTQDLEFR